MMENRPPTSVGEGFGSTEMPGKPFKVKRQSSFARFSACHVVIQKACDDFGVSVWALGRLLGLPHLNNVYRWLDGRHRPSQQYMTRLCALYQLQNRGVVIKDVHHVEWEANGVVVYKDAVTVSGTGGVRRKLSAAESGYKRRIAPGSGS